MFLRRIYSELLAEKTRIVLTVLAVAWGTFAITSMLAIGEGIRVTFATSVENVGHNLLEVTPGRTSKNFRGTHSNQAVHFTQQDFQNVSSLPNIDAISKQYNLSGKLQHDDILRYESILAVNANYSTIHKITIEPGGHFISPLDIKQHRAVIVLGTNTKKNLFPNRPNPVNEIIRYNGFPFKVIGVMKDKPQFIATDMPDEFSNWMPYSTYELMANPKTIDAFHITYKDKTFLPLLKKHIQKTIAFNHGYDPTDFTIVHHSNLAKQQTKINTFFSGMQIFLGIIGVLALFVAGVGIANVMYASVKHDTHDIGVRMAMGAKRYQVMWDYITEALSATFIGGTIGIAMSVLFVWTVNFLPMQGKLFDVIGKPHPILSWPVILTVLIILGLIGFFSGFFPALQAAKVDPAEALIYE